MLLRNKTFDANEGGLRGPNIGGATDIFLDFCTGQLTRVLTYEAGFFKPTILNPTLKTSWFLNPWHNHQVGLLIKLNLILNCIFKQSTLDCQTLKTIINQTANYFNLAWLLVKKQNKFPVFFPWLVERRLIESLRIICTNFQNLGRLLTKNQISYVNFYCCTD